ncbi:type I methionyl aminopeptidase [Halocella sp. SP3-1]|uniref:type I methionyl aminopeptidase n=1 Tax=Halocella sp. SP3-1 TaxID=2382161 RepID=UPI000F754269|nr:type I methionyl aminopeptidase [Halocella sp. SP3-1]AZO96525.1 type I methionyl aminopeptidase [Halocella sp. SP3-1]MTI60558.1 type I methionyl aminopeptidase [Bacillota bacterium]
MIVLKSPREINIMRQANQIVAETHHFLKEMIVVGITTAEIDRLGEEFIRNKGAVPSFKGYRGYPASVCVSINEEVVHGIPSKKRCVEDGDLLSLDIGAFYEGFHGDAARSFGVGKISNQARELIEVTEQSFFQGIEKAYPGNRLTDISNQIQKFVEGKGFSVVRDYVGHGIGREMHESPQIPNFGSPGRGPLLKKGMTLAIEPMVNVGTFRVKTLVDKWTVVTEDRKLSAHYENTIVITDNGPEILSKV